MRSFHFLNITQFLASLNENSFKILAIFFLLAIPGSSSADVLSEVGVIFVAPFLLFSSAGGILADRFCKKNLIILVKISEILFLIIGAFFIIQNSSTGLLATVFLMSTQSAILGPVKFSLIPELIDESKLSKANGIVSAFVCLAFILSTFMVSLILDLTNKNFLAVIFFQLFLAIIGFLACIGIRSTTSQNSKREINPFFLYEIYETLTLSQKIPKLNAAIFTSSYVFFLGAFLQLNMIPFAVESLHLEPEAGGYLFAVSSVGIVIGSLLTGLLSKDKIELSLCCFSGLGITCSCLFLYLFQYSLPLTLMSVMLGGIFIGMLLIPSSAFTQAKSPIEIRGQILGAGAFFAFVGMLFGALLIYLYSNLLQANAAVGFAYTAIISLIFTFLTTGQFSSDFFSFIERKLLKNNIVYTTPKPEEPVLLISRGSFWHVIPLFSLMPNLVVFIPSKYSFYFQWIYKFVPSIQIVPFQPDVFLQFLEEHRERQTSICCLCKEIDLKFIDAIRGIYPLFSIEIKKNKQLTISYEQL